jgi:hypothetical protein
VVPIFLTLLTAPLYIKYIGASRYGVLAIVWILLGYLGFMDLGLSRASENALGKLSSASSHERGRVIVTSYTWAGKSRWACTSSSLQT